MDTKILFLGAVQGLTEFLPVSSSGHLAFFQLLFGYESMLSYDVMLHLSTLLATICFFIKDIIRLKIEFLTRKGEGWGYGWAVIVGTVLTVMIALPLKKFVELAFSSPLLVAGGLFFTSMILWFISYIRPSEKKLSIKTGVVVGIAQGFAAMPGISRSGLTIFAGMFSGLSPAEAFRFSFILSIPAIIGATLLEALDMFRAGSVSLPDGWWGGCVLAFIFGLFSLALLKKFVIGGHWKIFSVYCAAIASLVLGLSIWS